LAKIPAYADDFAGKLIDQSYDEADLQASLAHLPKVAARVGASPAGPGRPRAPVSGFTGSLTETPYRPLVTSIVGDPARLRWPRPPLR
jgi:hypothetical protein